MTKKPIAGQNTTKAIEDLEQSVARVIEIVESSYNFEPLKARVDLLVSTASLITSVKGLWADDEADATMNARIAQIEAEIASCLEELKGEGSA